MGDQAAYRPDQEPVPKPKREAEYGHDFQGSQERGSVTSSGSGEYRPESYTRCGRDGERRDIELESDSILSQFRRSREIGEDEAPALLTDRYRYCDDHHGRSGVPQLRS